jgi:hypothetical protein
MKTAPSRFRHSRSATAPFSLLPASPQAQSSASSRTRLLSMLIDQALDIINSANDLDAIALGRNNEETSIPPTN